MNYTALAKSLNQHLDNCAKDSDLDILETAVHAMADIFNSRDEEFSRKAFLRDCGMAHSHLTK